jgi:divalent metal cation (Fe/Co/Zn/Cd) transporter
MAGKGSVRAGWKQGTRTSTATPTASSTPRSSARAKACARWGWAGNQLAAIVRTRAGRRLHSPALVADGDHARADAYVSLAVVASAILVALGADIADPLIGLAVTLVILRITWNSWQTVRGG